MYSSQTVELQFKSREDHVGKKKERVYVCEKEFNRERERDRKKRSVKGTTTYKKCHFEKVSPLQRNSQPTRSKNTQ